MTAENTLRLDTREAKVGPARVPWSGFDRVDEGVREAVQRIAGRQVWAAAKAVYGDPQAELNRRLSREVAMMPLQHYWPTEDDDDDDA